MKKNIIINGGSKGTLNNTLKKNRKLLIVTVILMMAVFIVFLNNSFGYFKKNIEGAKVTFNVGNLSYELECVDLTGCEVTIPANTSKVMNVNLTSLNTIDTKYEIYYEVISPKELTNVIDGGHLVTEGEMLTYLISANETKGIELVINNTGDLDITIKLGVLPSLKSDNATLAETQISLNKESYLKYYVYDYTKNYETFVVPADGYYQLEVWGASGGYATSDTYNGGYGGYSNGKIYLEKGTTLYVYVGGQGTNSKAGTIATYSGGYNGGGNGYVHRTSNGSSGAGGGGATHIAKELGLLSSLSSYVDDILIVAGGGGGGFTDTDSSGYSSLGGSGGGYIGASITQTGSCNSSCTSYSYPSGGTQSSGGLGVTSWSSGATSSTSYVGKFGQGATGTNTYGGGGGGYYGGASGQYVAGSGGSGYIGNTNLINKVMYCYNCTESTEDATRTVSTTNVSETPIGNNAKQGNGYARITFLGSGTYTIRYNSNGGEGTMEDVSVLEKEIYTLDKNTFIKDGYGFAGWSLSSDSNEVIYSDSEVVNNLAKADEVVNLYAVWLKSYTITFDANGGSVSPSSKSVLYGLSYGELPIPVKNGYTFQGWYTAASEGTKIMSSDIVSIDTDQTLYAQWSENPIAATYITDLAPTGLDTTAYNGMYRFTGSNADNYVSLDGVLYRIVGITSSANSTLGIEAGQIKLIKATNMTARAWHSALTSDVYWTSSQIYTYLQGTNVLGNTSIIPSGWVDKISSLKWYMGVCQTTAGVSTIIGCEDNNVTGSTSKIGLIYLSDYYYSIVSGGGTSGYYQVANNSWIGVENGWTMTRYGYHPDGYYSTWQCGIGGCYRPGTSTTQGVKPVFYLLPSVTFVSGTGTESDPFILD